MLLVRGFLLPNSHLKHALTSASWQPSRCAVTAWQLRFHHQMIQLYLFRNDSPADRTCAHCRVTMATDLRWQRRPGERDRGAEHRELPLGNKMRNLHERTAVGMAESRESMTTKRRYSFKSSQTKNTFIQRPPWKASGTIVSIAVSIKYTYALSAWWPAAETFDKK